MAFRRAHIAATAVSASLIIVSSMVARRAAGASCLEAIDERTTRTIFDGLVKVGTRDGCTVQGVSTEQALLRVVWMKEGQPLEPILVVPTSCATGSTSHGKLTASVPASVTRACPAAADMTRTLVEGESVTALVPIQKEISVPELQGRVPPRAGKRFALVGTGIAALLSGGLRLFFRRRAKGSPPPLPPPGASTR